MIEVVIVSCAEPGCDHGACYVVPADPPWPGGYHGGHRVRDDPGTVHRSVQVTRAHYDGDMSNAAAVMTWANRVVAAKPEPVVDEETPE